MQVTKTLQNRVGLDVITMQNTVIEGLQLLHQQLVELIVVGLITQAFHDEVHASNTELANPAVEGERDLVETVFLGSWLVHSDHPPEPVAQYHPNPGRS